MKANPEFLNNPPEFWAYVKLLNQRLGYVERLSKKNSYPKSVVPDISDVVTVFSGEKLDYSYITDGKSWTEFGEKLHKYFIYRQYTLENIRNLLLTKEQAKDIFEKLHKTHKDKITCPLPYNKQTGDKAGYAYLTCIVNILINITLLETKNTYGCDYDPREMTLIIKDNKPIRVLSRRVDGAYPSIRNPIAIWEIKEYYNTTTFGSRIADGVYETQLDGWELSEIKDSLDIDIEHYLITDNYLTWWVQGKSYLCRIIDSLHMGLLTEALFGKEVIDGIPNIVRRWTKELP